MDELIWQPAREIVRLVHERQIRAVDVMSAYYDQIERLNPTLNAIVNLIPRDDAMALAQGAD
ncbi:MAG: amidase, partial [Gammaproteobacteria bacterium]|nr:amidase [Gammaproteobacteria bacterium]